MQQVASQPHSNPNFRSANGRNNRSTTIVILALLLFALSGLMTGFATGAFTRFKQSQPHGNNNKTNQPGKTVTTPVHTQTPQLTQTPSIEVLGLGCPGIVGYTPQEIQNGSYKFQTQMLDKSSGCQNGGQPLHVPGITCRLWLTKDNNFGANIPYDRIKSVTTLQDAFPKEEQGALIFNGTTQVQACNAQGATVWDYQLAPSVSDGTYFLVVLADWQGILYNWTARQISITKAS